MYHSKKPAHPLVAAIKRLTHFCITYGETILIISYFLGIIAYFYTAPTIGLTNNFLFNILALTVLTDGMFLFLHLPRKPVKHANLSCDPSKLSVIIACRNGEEVIGDTIKGALVHVLPHQIIVVSDLSTDNTAAVARNYGVRVVENTRNLNKALSISSVAHLVDTPYVLVLDDDTLIGETFIPTSLLDQGYGAVAFNVLPVKTNTLVNAFQLFEYRKSMVMGKSLRGNTGAVGNVSGALGLYRTEDLQHQVNHHSGQYGGEDQQRTAFVHLYSKGRGVTFTDSTVYTKVPDSWKIFLRQRCFRWNLSLPELCMLNLRILMTPRMPFLLKVEKAYKLYLLVTDPLRIAFFWVAFLSPLRTAILYGVYVLFNTLSWFKTGRKDPYWLVLLFPIYSSLRATCRLIAHTHWILVKFRYLFNHRFHILVPTRKLTFEYACIFLLLIGLWSNALSRLTQEGVGTYISRTVQDSPIVRFITRPEPVVAAEPEPLPPIKKTTISVTVERGNGLIHVARKAMLQYSENNGITLKKSQQRTIENAIRKNLPYQGKLSVGQVIEVDREMVKQEINAVLTP